MIGRASPTHIRRETDRWQYLRHPCSRVQERFSGARSSAMPIAEFRWQLGVQRVSFRINCFAIHHTFRRRIYMTPNYSYLCCIPIEPPETGLALDCVAR